MNRIPRFMKEYGSHINSMSKLENLAETTSKVYTVLQSYKHGLLTVADAMKELNGIEWEVREM